MHFNQHIADLAQILKQQGVRHVIICPGSRNAPLMQVLTRDDHFSCHSIVDERSAAYVALGMARQLDEPLLVVSTSGTATLNLGPAVAEAWFQKIPLIVLTADRPAEWPPQFSNQIVKQENLFAANSKGFYGVPIDIENDVALLEVLKGMNAAIGKANSGVKGPIHINIPLKEPLYEVITKDISEACNRIEESVDEGHASVDAEDQKIISAYLKDQKRVLIIAGVQAYSAEEELLLIGLATHYNVVVIAENITNLKAPFFVHQPDLILGSMPVENNTLLPELVVSFGGQVVSKKTRLFVQHLKDTPVKVLEIFPFRMFEDLVLNHSGESAYSYFMEWRRIEEKALEKLDKFIPDNSFCNLTAMAGILHTIPADSVVHLGNSSTIRYSQVFPQRGELTYFGNRGTSGIDGSLSTAVGAAMVSDKLHVAILGDLSFIYDSNAMWNRKFPENLKIIVLNDEGGGIFRILNGPDKMPFFEEFSVTSHQVSLHQLAGAFDLKHLRVSDHKELNDGLSDLFNEGGKLSVLEVLTTKSENSSIFKKFFKSLQDQ